MTEYCANSKGVSKSADAQLEIDRFPAGYRTPTGYPTILEHRCPRAQHPKSIEHDGVWTTGHLISRWMRRMTRRIWTLSETDPRRIQRCEQHFPCPTVLQSLQSGKPLPEFMCNAGSFSSARRPGQLAAFWFRHLCRGMTGRSCCSYRPSSDSTRGLRH